MLQNNIELDLKTKLIESGTTQTEVAEKVGVSLAYLPSIRFICLAMSERYIENHFSEIIGYESEIEDRLVDEDCTIESLKAGNRDIINGIQHAGEQVVLIDSDYEQTIKGLLDRQSEFEEI